MAVLPSLKKKKKKEVKYKALFNPEIADDRNIHHCSSVVQVQVTEISAAVNALNNCTMFEHTVEPQVTNNSSQTKNDASGDEQCLEEQARKREEGRMFLVLWSAKWGEM